jgi:hypothetical protein
LPNVWWLSCQTFKWYAVERDIPRHLFNYDYKNLEKLLKNIWFTIIKKRKMESIWSSESLNKLLKDKYWIEFLKSKAFIPLRILLIIGDILCTLCNQWSQMWFIIKKS